MKTQIGRAGVALYALLWGIRGKPNAIPGWSRTRFRVESERCSGLMVNAVPARCRTLFAQARNRVRHRRNVFHRRRMDAGQKHGNL